ncbi:hypothetical protein TD95_004792 [Thielaviopsis punctulata]|uniref:DUF726 domain protein n=1 Tax=Thielaviopsis punctulata TaxID=72032 RepID=A0A0F4ZF61_9PEZI|nr:hypothetical protein TD95_004792 [Thielaviopsis punctulata]
MARGRGGFGGGRRPVCLTGIISGGERDDLASLLVSITETMSLNMTGIFYDGASLRLARNSMDGFQKENLPPRSFSTSGSASGTQSDDDDPALLRELKKEALSFFRKWQTALINRTRDLEASDEPNASAFSELQISGRSRAGKGRGGRNSGRSGRNASGIKPSPRVGPVRPAPIQQTDPSLRRFLPIATPLWLLPIERRRLLQNIAFLMVLSLEDYSAYGRTAMMYVASSLNLTMRNLQEDEVRIGRSLGKISLDFALGEMARRIEEGAEMPRGRQTGINRANDTEFLAGPISNSTLGRCINGVVLDGNATMELLGQLGDNGVAMGSLFAFYGAKATGKSMDAYAKDVQDFAMIPIHGKNNKGEPLLDTRDIHPHDRRLRMVVCINGSILDEDDNVTDAWSCFGNQAEVYTLRWETNSLRSLASCMEMTADSRGWEETCEYFKTHSIRDAFAKSEWPKSIERLSKVLDNPWTVGMVRADKVGLVLADIIQRKVQGGRPTSLVGYGLGARSIYTCLLALAERRQFGLIESVLMMGCPAPSSPHVWMAMKSVVNGRLINAHSSTDYMMPYMYRLADVKYGLAGIEAIKDVPGVENYDVGDLPCGYMRYQYMTGKVMQQVGWEDIDHETVANEAVKLAELDKKYGVATTSRRAPPPTKSFAAVPPASPQPLQPLRPSSLNEKRPSLARTGSSRRGSSRPGSSRGGFHAPTSFASTPNPFAHSSQGSMLTPPPRNTQDGPGHSRNRSNSTASNHSHSNSYVSVSSGPTSSGRSAWGNNKSIAIEIPKSGNGSGGSGRGSRRNGRNSHGYHEGSRGENAYSTYSGHDYSSSSNESSTASSVGHYGPVGTDRDEPNNWVKANGRRRRGGNREPRRFEDDDIPREQRRVGGGGRRGGRANGGMVRTAINGN